MASHETGSMKRETSQGHETKAPIAVPDLAGAHHPGLILREEHLPGLQVAVGFGKDDTSRTGCFSLSLAEDVTGIVVLYPFDESAGENVRREFSQAFGESSDPREAATNFLRTLDREIGSEYVFIGIWQARSQVLTYFTTGFEPPSVINATWPHRSDDAISRETLNGKQNIAFGMHPLGRRERWLVFTKPLVDVPDPRNEPFNSVGIIQYARHDCMMPNDRWVNYLLALGTKAHGGKLPSGSILISLARGEGEAAYGIKNKYFSLEREENGME